MSEAVAPAAPAATAPPSPAPSGDLIGGAAPATATPPDPREWLPEEYRGDPAFQSFKSIESLAKSYRDTAKMVGVDKAQVLRLPKDEAAPEWGEVWAKLGRPESPDGYQIEGEHGLPDGTLAAFRETAHKMGLPQRQAQEVVAFYAQQQATQREALREQAVADLSKEWGGAFADRVGVAQKAAEQFGGPELMDVLKATGLGNHPAVVRAFAKIGMEMAEPGELKGGGGRMSAAMTPADATAAIGQKRRDTEFMAAYNDRDHPGHGHAVKEMGDLYEQAIPNNS